MIVWGIIALILLLIVIGLVIWLLVRGSGTVNKAGLNQACTTNTDCNGGLICSPTGVPPVGVTGTTGIPGGRVCKVANGGVCNANTDCANGSVCRNGVCQVPLGTQGRPCPCDVGFTCVNSVCRAVVGQACMSNADCSTGNCINNVCMPSGMTGFTGMTGCFDSSDCTDSWRRRHCDSSSDFTSDEHRHRRRHDSDDSDDHRRRRKHSSESEEHRRRKCDTSDDCSRNDSNHSRDSRDSGSRNHSTEDSHNERRHRLSSDFFSCSKSDCSGTKFSLSTSDESRADCKKESNSFSLTSCCETSSDERGVRRGVYRVTQSGQDQTMFTAIDQPIIDIAKTDKIYLLLKNGNIAANMGINNVIYNTDRKMDRMVRFGNDIVGLDKKGRLYYAVKSANNVWTWVGLKNFPCDVVFINSTNSPPSNILEVTTSNGKAYVFTYSSSWKEGNKTSSRKTRDLRFYGKDANVWLDINEDSNIGKTNDGTKVKHIKGGGFFTNNTLISVLTNDCFTHVRVIDNNAYFLFEQR